MLQLYFKLIVSAWLICWATGCDQPLVVGGGGMSTRTGGNDYLTVIGSPAQVKKEDPIRCAARFEFSFDPKLDADFSGCSEGNTPDKFVWNGEYRYFIDGAPFSIKLTIDGRKENIIFDGRKFRLAKGNHFRIHVGPGPLAEIEQLAIVNTKYDVDDKNLAASIFENAAKNSD